MEQVAIIIEDMRMGGPQKQLIYFLQEVIKLKKKPKFKLFVPNGSKNKISNFVNLNKINVEELNIQYLSKYNFLKYLLFFFKDFFQIKKKLNNIQKVYICGGSSNFKSLLISIILKKKVYLHIHDIRCNVLIKIILFVLSKFIKKIFFASECSKNYYDFVSKKPKKIILRSSVNTKYYTKKHLKKKKFTIGMIANINPDKNLELLLEIAKQTDDKSVRYILIGNLFNSQKKYFKKKIFELKNKNKITWYKNIDNPKKIMNTFDILISTSKYESLPLSIIEALSMSIPVISTNVGDISYVLNKKKCGYIIKSSSGSFINMINKLKENSNLIFRLSKNARINAVKNFNIKNYTKKLIDEIV